MTLHGRVTSGLGHSSQGADSLWDSFQEVSGIQKLVRGTLNVRLESEFILPDSASLLPAADWDGPHDMLLLKCQLQGHDSVIIRTLPNNEGTGPISRAILEIASGVDFREDCGLSDGDDVIVTLDG